MTSLARLLFSAFLLFLAYPTNAAELGPSLQRMASESFSDIEGGIADLAASGDARAPAILDALSANRLVYDPATRIAYIKSGADLVDAASGAAASPASTKPIRLNNRVRTAIASAMGSLTLLSADPAKRLSAADNAFKSRDPAALGPVTDALGRESDPRVKRAFASARAAILLASKEAPAADRLAAVDAMRARADQEALAVLRQAALDAQPPLKPAVESAISSIENRLALINTVQNVWYGVSLGSVLLLAAIGLAITFGVMGVINMAHGEMVMLGAYTTFVVQEGVRQNAPGLFDWSLPIAIPLAFLVSAMVGVIIERTVIRFLYGRPLETLLATFGVSLILQQAVRTAFGSSNREVGAPSYMSGAFDFFGLSITYGRLWIVVFTLVVFGLLQLVLKATPLGLQMRAVTQNRRMASAMGIRTGFVDAMTFALGSGIAGLAGVALSQIDNVSPNLGQGYIVDSFMVVVFGGVGNLWGTLLGATLLGIANKLLEPFAGAVLGKIAILVFIILFIQKRPRGLFALKGRAVEA